MSAERAIRVLFDCRMATWTGVGRYTRDLAEALSRRADIELVQVVSPGQSAPVSAAVWRESAGHPFSLSGARAFGRVAAAVRADVVHCPHYPTPLPLAHPLVVTVHDFIPLTVPGVMPSATRRLVYRVLLRRAVKGADRIITLSRHSAEETERFWPGSSAKITVVPAAADDFSAGPAGDLPSGVACLGRYVFALGTTRPHKRLDVLLRAWAAIESRVPEDVWLVLSGDEPAGFVADALGDLPHPRRLLWAGVVDDCGLRALYAGAAAFVFPSSHEGFGLPPLEAMALGAPVVCTDATSLPEVVGDAALLVPAGDPGALGEAVIRVLTDHALADELSARGRAQAALFSWDITAERTADVYRALARQ